MDFQNLRTVNDSIIFVQDQVAKALYKTDPTRAIYRSENDVPTLTTMYSVLDNGFIVGTSEVFARNTRREVVDSVEMAATDVIREYSYAFSIIAAKLDPDRYLTTFIHNLWLDQFHSTYFGQFEELGVREVGQVLDTSVPIDQQGWETRATLPITFSFLARETEITPYIETVTGMTKVRSAGSPDLNGDFEVTQS